MTWYPYDQLGPRYVHTNYNSFMYGMSMGSFGDHTALMDIALADAITRQRDRETEIENLFKEIIGEGFTFEEFGEQYEEVVTKYAYNTLADNYVTAKGLKPRKDKHGSITSLAFSTKHLNENFKLLENVTDAVTELLQEFTKKGYIEADGVAAIRQRLHGHLNSISGKIKDWKDGGKKGDLPSMLYGTVMNFKGAIKEYIEPILHNATLDEITNGLITAGQMKGFKVEAVGGPGKPGADAKALIETGGKSLSYGLNIKSASRDTFKKHGVGLYRTDRLINLIEHMQRYAESYEPINAFTYYLINVSRMMGRRMTAQQGPGGLKATSEGRTLVHSIIKAYAPLFIGEDDPQIPEEFRRADFLVLQNMFIRKSVILEELSKGRGFSIALEITYDKTYDWHKFDYAKRMHMREADGDYHFVASRYFVDRGVEAMLNQAATIKLKMLAGFKY